MSAPLPELAPDVSFEKAGRAVLHHQLSLLLSALPGLRDNDPEAVHDLRVASRRLRASLAVFAKLFPMEQVREVERQIARLTAGFGVVRDLDVQIDALRTMCADLPSDQQYGLQRTVERLVRKRTGERKALKKLLDELEKGKLEKRLRRLLEEGS